jgi:hypothetical protein
MQVNKDSAKNRTLALWAIAALFLGPTLIAQDIATKEKAVVPTLAFGVDRADNLVIRDISTQGHAGPIVGEPTCLQFVQPCPHASTPKGVTNGGSFSVPASQEPKNNENNNSLFNLALGKEPNVMNNDGPFSLPAGQESNGTNNDSSFSFPASQEYGDANNDSSFSLPASREPAYKIEFEAMHPKNGPSLPLKISGGDGDSLKVVKPEDWTLTLKGYKSRKKQWDVVIEPQEMKKDTGNADGCWVEVSCPPPSKG